MLSGGNDLGVPTESPRVTRHTNIGNTVSSRDMRHGRPGAMRLGYTMMIWGCKMAAMDAGRNEH